MKFDETRRVTPHQTSTRKTKPSTTILIWTMLTVCHRTRSFLDVVRCCMSLKTTKLWSRWFWRAEVQQCDTFQELTELRWIGCLTESIWTPRFKSNTQTYWQSEISHVMSGTIFCVCSTSAIFQCVLAAILAIIFLIRSESSAPCQREFRKATWKRDRQWQSRSLWNWTSRAWGKFLKFGPEWCPSTQLETVCVGHPTLYSEERQQNDAQTSNTKKQERRDESSARLAAGNSLRKGEVHPFGRRKQEFHTCRSPIPVLGKSLQEHEGKGESCRRCTTSGDSRTQN